MHDFRYRFAAECLTPLIRQAFGLRAPPYNLVVELDRKIRKLCSEHGVGLTNGQPVPFGSLEETTAMENYVKVVHRESGEFLTCRPDAWGLEAYGHQLCFIYIVPFLFGPFLLILPILNIPSMASRSRAHMIQRCLLYRWLVKSFRHTLSLCHEHFYFGATLYVRYLF